MRQFVLEHVVRHSSARGPKFTTFLCCFNDVSERRSMRQMRQIVLEHVVCHSSARGPNLSLPCAASMMSVNFIYGTD
jgi:hypothetical protein